MKTVYTTDKWHPLTMADHPGKLTWFDMIRNIIIMWMMEAPEEGDSLRIFSAIECVEEMDQEDYRGWEECAIDILQDWNLQCYLERQGIRLGQDLHPVGGADLADYWETLNKWDLETFLEQEVYR